MDCEVLREVPSVVVQGLLDQVLDQVDVHDPGALQLLLHCEPEAVMSATSAYPRTAASISISLMSMESLLSLRWSSNWRIVLPPLEVACSALMALISVVAIQSVL